MPSTAAMAAVTARSAVAASSRPARVRREQFVDVEEFGVPAGAHDEVQVVVLRASTAAVRELADVEVAVLVAGVDGVEVEDRRASPSSGSSHDSR